MKGSVASQLLDVIRKEGFNQEMTIELGEVIGTSPFLMRLQKDKLELDSEDVVFAERLTVNPLHEGDLLILISETRTSTFYAIDRVGVMK